MNGLDRRDRVVLIFHVRAARKKALDVAMAEALCLLRDLDPAALPGGPLSEQGGLFWIDLPPNLLAIAMGRLSRLGYSRAVDLVQPIEESRLESAPVASNDDRRVRWRRKIHRLARLYEEDPARSRDMAPDRRAFLLETFQGQVRPIQGYRGDGRPLRRRGLPVYDARLLVNLVFRSEPGSLLDAFAGVGGIVIEAAASGWSVVSCDIDPALRHGLAALGATHYVCDARSLPLPEDSVDAIATEPPYGREAATMLPAALKEMHRVLRPGGRMAILAAAWQADILRADALMLDLRSYLDSAINRKGLDVVVLAWEK